MDKKIRQLEQRIKSGDEIAQTELIAYLIRKGSMSLETATLCSVLELPAFRTYMQLNHSEKLDLTFDDLESFVEPQTAHLLRLRRSLLLVVRLIDFCKEHDLFPNDPEENRHEGWPQPPAVVIHDSVSFLGELLVELETSRQLRPAKDSLELLIGWLENIAVQFDENPNFQTIVEEFQLHGAANLGTQWSTELIEVFLLVAISNLLVGFFNLNPFEEDIPFYEELGTYDLYVDNELTPDAMPAFLSVVSANEAEILWEDGAFILLSSMVQETTSNNPLAQDFSNRMHLFIQVQLIIFLLGDFPIFLGLHHLDGL